MAATTEASAAPRVSVVIPCYNLGAYVTEAVDSVLAQTYQDFEILIVDDGSTDPATISVLDALDRPKTTVFRTPNRGLAAARNFLVGHARGEYLCALDADDRLHPEYLTRTLAVLERDASIGFVSTRMQMFGAETREWPDDTRCDLETLLCHDPVHCAALVRRSAVLAAGGYDERMAHQGNEDWDLWIGIAESGLSGVILDEVLFFYRRREGSMSDDCTRGDAHLDSVEHIVRKHEGSYRAHLPAVTRWKDASLADLDARNASARGRHHGNGRDSRAISRRAGRAEAPARRDRGTARQADRSRIGLPGRFGRGGGSAGLGELEGDRATARVVRRVHGRSPTRPTMSNDVTAALLDKERRILEAQLRHDALSHHRVALDAELHALKRDIADVVQRLRALGRDRVEFGDLRRTTPISPVWGLDRGLPLDRYYIEGFLDRHRLDIGGRVLEVKDSGYTRMFGGERVTRADVLDVDAGNANATVVADLSRADAIPDDAYDCFILTQTLGVIYDAAAAVRHAVRVLKPGGVLLCTLPAAGRIRYEEGLDGDFWRFTEGSVRRLFGEALPPSAFEVAGHGNVLTCAAFLYGLAQDELTREELDVVDPFFPLVYTVRAMKASAAAPPVSSGPHTVQAVGGVLTYHRIAEPAHERDRISVAADEFRGHMQHLRDAGYRVLPLAELVAAASAGSLESRSVALTFDDGYLDALTSAAPILESFGYPATFFIVGEALDAPHEFWWDALDRIFLSDHQLPARLALTLPGGVIEMPTASRADRGAARDRLTASFYDLGCGRPRVQPANAARLERHASGHREPAAADDGRRGRASGVAAWPLDRRALASSPAAAALVRGRASRRHSYLPAPARNPYRPACAGVLVSVWIRGRRYRGHGARRGIRPRGHHRRAPADRAGGRAAGTANRRREHRCAGIRPAPRIPGGLSRPRYGVRGRPSARNGVVTFQLQDCRMSASCRSSSATLRISAPRSPSRSWPWRSTSRYWRSSRSNWPRSSA